MRKIEAIKSSYSPFLQGFGVVLGERERVKKEENLTRLAALPGRLGFNFFSIFGFRKDVRVACRS